MAGSVVALARSGSHDFSKACCESLRLFSGIGIAGDAHAGATVQHRSRVAVDPSQPNLRQVHLIHHELLDQLAAEGFDVAPGQLGENMTTRGMDLLALPTGTKLHIGETVLVEVTGLRNPCQQIEAFRPGLLGRLVHKREDGSIERLAGVMGIVLAGGEVACGDPVAVELPPEPHQQLQPV